MDLSKKPLAAALGAAFLATALSPLVSAETDPFAATQLSGGFDLVNYGEEADAEEGSCGEGKCGEGEGEDDGEEEAEDDGEEEAEEAAEE